MEGGCSERQRASQRWTWMRESCSAQEKEATKPRLRRAGSNIGFLQRPGRPLFKWPQQPELQQSCIYEGMKESRAAAASELLIPSVVSFGRDLARHHTSRPQLHANAQDQPGGCVWRHQAMHLRFGLCFFLGEWYVHGFRRHQRQSPQRNARPASKKDAWLTAQPRVVVRHFIVLCIVSPRLLSTTNCPSPCRLGICESLLCIYVCVLPARWTTVSRGQKQNHHTWCDMLPTLLHPHSIPLRIKTLSTIHSLPKIDRRVRAFPAVEFALDV